MNENEELERQQVDAISKDVGTLVLLTSHLDFEVSKITAASLPIPAGPINQSVMGMIDINRKVELMRARAATIGASDWRMALKKFADGVDQVNKVRNIACHSVLRQVDGKWILAGESTTKILKRLKLEGTVLKAVEIDHLQQIRDAIKTAEALLDEAKNIYSRFDAFRTAALASLPSAGSI